MDYQQEPREYFGGSMIKMPMADFVKEHHHLIDVLKHGSRKAQTAEANSQANELKRRGKGITSSKTSAKVVPITEEAKEDHGIGVGNVTLLTLEEKVDHDKRKFRANKEREAAEKAAKKKSKRGHLRQLKSFFF